MENMQKNLPIITSTIGSIITCTKCKRRNATNLKQFCGNFVNYLKPIMCFICLKVFNSLACDIDWATKSFVDASVQCNVHFSLPIIFLHKVIPKNVQIFRRKKIFYYDRRAKGLQNSVISY